MRAGVRACVSTACVRGFRAGISCEDSVRDSSAGILCEDFVQRFQAGIPCEDSGMEPGSEMSPLLKLLNSSCFSFFFTQVVGVDIYDLLSLLSPVSWVSDLRLLLLHTFSDTI